MLESRYAPPGDPAGCGCTETSQCAPPSLVMYAYRFDTAAQTHGVAGWAARLRSPIGVPSTVLKPVVVRFASCQYSAPETLVQEDAPVRHRYTPAGEPLNVRYCSGLPPAGTMRT